MQHTILCIDVGTTSLKAAYIGSSGELYAFSRQFFSGNSDADKALEWLPALKHAVDDIKKSLADKKKLLPADQNRQDTKKIPEPTAVCISGNGPTIVSESGKTLLWNEKITGQTLVKNTETHSLFIPRIAAFREKFKNEWENSRNIFSGPEYLIWILTGKAVTILPEKRYEPAYWTKEDLAEFGIDAAKLPPFVSPSYNAGKIKSKIADESGVPKNIPVFCGAPDFIAAMIGTNALYKNRLYDCAGSSEGINLCTPFPFSEPGILTLPSVIPGIWNAAFLIPDSGIRFEKYRQNLERNSGKSLSYQEVADNAISGRDKQGFLLLQDMALKVKEGIGKLKKTANKEGSPWPEVMITTGGQVQNERWIQMKADIAETAIALTMNVNAELTGDAVLAATGLGIYPDIRTAAEKMVHILKVCYPKKTNLTLQTFPNGA